jgi:hypothetical protein
MESGIISLSFAPKGARFRPSPPSKSLYLMRLSASWESESHRNLHLFGCPFRNWSLLGYRSPTARSHDSRRCLHTHNQKGVSPANL